MHCSDLLCITQAVEGCGLKRKAVAEWLICNLDGSANATTLRFVLICKIWTKVESMQSLFHTTKGVFLAETYTTYFRSIRKAPLSIRA